VLGDILVESRRRAEALPPLPELRARAADAAPARDFPAALASPGLGVVAEVKRRSPSKGDLAPGLDPVAQVGRYAAGGAVAVSVLTEPTAFGGSLADLAAVRAACDLPVLRKDFTVSASQVWEARAAGADAVLLIAAVLDDTELRGFLEAATEAGLAALVEVHTEREAERALRAGAAVVGVNNRDLATFRVDLATAEHLAPLLAGRVRVAESGIAGPDDAARMAAAGYDAVLVGESLVRSSDPAGLVRRLAGVAVTGGTLR